MRFKVSMKNEVVLFTSQRNKVEPKRLCGGPGGDATVCFSVNAVHRRKWP